MAACLYLGQWMKDNMDQIDRCINTGNIDDETDIQDELLSTSIAEADALEQIDQRKKFLEGLMVIVKQGVVIKTSDSRCLTDDEAAAVVHCLSQRRPFSRSFRYYLKKVGLFVMDVMVSDLSCVCSHAQQAEGYDVLLVGLLLLYLLHVGFQRQRGLLLLRSDESWILICGFQ